MGENRMHEANCIVLLISLLINFTFTVIYIVEASQGQRQWTTAILFMGLVAIIFRKLLKLYIRDKAHPDIKYSVLSGFMAIYLYTMVTFQYAHTYIFIFISLVLYVMYSDHSLCKRIILATIIVSIIKMLHDFFILGLNYKELLSEYIIQGSIILVMCIKLVWHSKVLFKNNKEEVSQLDITQPI